MVNHEEHEGGEAGQGTPQGDSPDEVGGENPPLRRPRHRRRARVGWFIAGGVLLVAVAVLAVVFFTNSSEKDPARVVTVLGVEYVTNVDVEAQKGYIYVFMPVNTDTKSVVLEVAEDNDSEKIREFLDSLDTLVPGEHVLSLGDSNLHFIIDGIEGMNE